VCKEDEGLMSGTAGEEKRTTRMDHEGWGSSPREEQDLARPSGRGSGRRRKRLD